MIIDQLKNKKWHYFHKRFRTPIYTYFILDGVSKPHNTDLSLPFPCEITSFIYLDTELAAGEEEWEALRHLVNAELKINPQFILDVIKIAYETNDRIVAFAEGIEQASTSEFSKEELLENWEEYAKLTMDFAAFLGMPLFVEQDMELRLKNHIKVTLGAERVEEVFQILTTPIKPGVTQESEINLLRLAIQKSKGEDIDKALDDHVRRFAWAKNNSFNGQFYAKEEFVSHMQEMLQNPEEKYNDYIAKIDGTKSKFTEYRNLFADLSEVTSLIDTLQESIYFRSWRTERYYCNAYLLRAFFAKTAEVLGLDEPTDLFYLVSDEIIALLRGETTLDREKLKERKVGYFVYSDRTTSYILSGEDLERAKKEIDVKPVNDSKEIKGQTAYPGIVTGPARVILDKSELHKVQDGDILVTTSTTVDYVPVLKKVKAIVTEEGGVLSHASVISRELHIPCVIGTKIATKILKDNDHIEVDASAGLIKRL